MPCTIMEMGEVQITAGKPWYPRKFEVAPRRSRTSRATLSSSNVVTPGLAEARVAACISATTLPARRILASSSSLRLIERPLLLLLQLTQGVDRADDAARHGVGRARAVDLGQQGAFLVPVEQRGRLLLVEVEPAFDRLLGVVLALHHLAAADVTGPIDQRRGGRRVVGAAVHADAPA